MRQKYGRSAIVDIAMLEKSPWSFDQKQSGSLPLSLTAKLGRSRQTSAFDCLPSSWQTNDMTKHHKQCFSWFTVILGEDLKTGICSVLKLQDYEKEKGMPAVDTAAGQADLQCEINKSGG